MSDEEFQRLLKTPPAPTACPHCGAAAPAGGAFCDNCGEPLQAEAAAATTDAPPPPPESVAVSTPVPAASGNPHTSPGLATPPPTNVVDAGQPTAPMASPMPAPAGPAISFDLSGPSASSSVTMAGDEVKIGRRDADSGIYPEIDFDGNDIVVDGGERVHAVSRRHGRIFREGDLLKFEDLGSTNGSTVNGTAVLAKDPQPLKDGDTIVLGRTCRISVHMT
jgi:hypothetical protein